MACLQSLQVVLLLVLSIMASGQTLLYGARVALLPNLLPDFSRFIAINMFSFSEHYPVFWRHFFNGWPVFLNFK